MSVLVRAFLTFLGTALLVFAGFTGWYSWNFRAPSVQPQARLKPLLTQISHSVVNDNSQALQSLLNSLPFQVVITDPEGRILSSNLPARGREDRVKTAQSALKARDFNAKMATPDGLAQIYYSQTESFWNPVLWFPLIFSLLLGFLLSFWDYLKWGQTEDQIAEIRILTRETNPYQEDKTDVLLAEKERLSGKVIALQKQLEIAESRLEQTRVNLHQTQTKLSQQDAGDAREQAQVLETELAKIKQQLKRQEETIRLQEQVEKHWHEKQITWNQEQQAFKQVVRERESELSKLEKAFQEKSEALSQSQQTAREKQQQLGQINQRLLELEDINRQLYEAYQEIEKLRKSELELMRRDEAWQKEKQKLLNLISEREQWLQDSRDKLSKNRQKLHELSVAYKRELELGQNLPADLSQARDLMGHLIADKDDIERENAQLQIALADHNSEINHLRKELEMRALANQESDYRIEGLEKELKKLRLELELVGDTLSDKLLDLDRLSQSHSEDSLALEGLMQERDSLKLSLLDSELHLEQISEENARLLFEKESLAEKLETIDIQDYELQIEQLKQSLQVVGAQQQRKQEATLILKEKLKQGAELYEKLKRQVESKERKIDQLHEDLTRKESIIHLLEQKLENAGIVGPASNF
jgi:chromosome segregation ATPase